MDMRRSRPESSSGEGHQHASEAGPSTERSTNVATISPPPEGSSSSTVSHQPSSLPSSVPSQTHIQLQQASHPPSPLPNPPQTDQTNTNISNLTAPRPSTIIPIMHGSASAAVRPPIPLEPPTNTTFSELNSNGEETLQRFQQGNYWDPQASLQDLSASMVRLETMRAAFAVSIDEFDRARSTTTSHERMMLAVDRDRMVPGLPSGSRTAVDDAYERMMERTGGSFPAVRTRTRGPEIMLLPPRSPQGTGGGPADDDDGVTLRGRRVMAHQALASSSRQTESQQNQATGERLQVVLTSIGGSLASLHGRQLPPPFVTTDREIQPLLQHLSRDLPSPSANLPNVVPPPISVIRISSPPRRGSPSPADPTSPWPPHPPVQPSTIIERTPSPAQSTPPPTVIRISSPSPYRADSTSPRPPHPPVQPSTIIERTPSPTLSFVYPPSLTHIRYVFDPTGATPPTLAIAERGNPAAVVLSRDGSPIPLRGEYRQPLLDQPHPLRRRLDDSGRSVGVARYSPGPPSPVGYWPQSPQQYIHDPTNPLSPPLRPRPRSPTPSDVDYSTLRGWEVVYPSFYPSSPQPDQEAAAFVPPGITDSALPTPRPFNPRPPRRAWRPEDPNGDETITDDEDPAAEELQMELRRRSRLMSRSTTNVNDPYEALALIARVDSENQGPLRPGDESNDQEKHGVDDSGDTIMSGIRNGSVGSSRPGSRGSYRSFDLNFTGAGDGEVPIWPCPLPIPPSEMVSKPERVARQWKTRFTPIPPLHGSVARARAAAQAKGSRRVPRRYADPVGR